MRTLLPSRNNAFTLVELLIVTAGITLLLGLTVPAVVGISNSGSVTKAVYDIGNTLDQARSYAVAQNTYVWVEFTAPTTDVLAIKIYASRSQARDTSSTNRVLFSKTLNESNVSLVTNLPAYGNRESPDATLTPSEVIEFDPVGEARLLTAAETALATGTTAETALNRCISLNLQPTRGGAAVGANTAVLQIDGLTGHTRFFRP